MYGPSTESELVECVSVLQAFNAEYVKSRLAVIAFRTLQHILGQIVLYVFVLNGLLTQIRSD